MEITDKQILVLKAIVDFYISTGEPVGSKVICENLGYRVSSATIRNYMAELMRHGLIIQPHTSAGRIPSEKGIRTYIDRFVNVNEIKPEIKSYIDSELSACPDEPEEILNVAVNMVSRLCKCISVVTTPLCKDTRIYKIRFVQISRHTAMAILITGTGMVKTQLFRCDFIVTNEVMTIFERLVNDCFTGVPLKDVTPAFLQTTAVRLGEMGLLMSNVLWTVAKLCESADEINLISSDNLHSLTENAYSIEAINNIASFIKSKQDIVNYIINLDNGVFIGSENNRTELLDSCLITQNYVIEDDSRGLLSAICPIRSNYSFNIPVIRYTADAVAKLIRNITLMDN